MSKTITNNKFIKGKTYLVGALKESSKVRADYKVVPIDKTKTWYEKPADFFIDLGYNTFVDYLNENPNNLPSDTLYYIFEYNPETQFYNMVHKSQPNEVENFGEEFQTTSSSNNLSDKYLEMQSELYSKNIDMIESHKDKEIQMLKEQLQTLSQERKTNEIPYLEKLSETERNYKDLLIQKDNTITLLIDKLQSLQNELLEEKAKSAQLKSDYDHQVKLIELEKSLQSKFDEEQQTTLGKLDEIESASKINLGTLLNNLTQHPGSVDVVNRGLSLVEMIFNKFGGNNNQAPPPPPVNNYANNYVQPMQPQATQNQMNFDSLSKEQQEAIRDQIELEAYMKQQESSKVKAPNINNVPNFHN